MIKLEASKRLVLSAPSNKGLLEGYVTDKSVLKRALALKWTWYTTKKNLYKQTKHKLGMFMIQSDYPIGVAKYGSGYLYRHPGIDSYLYYSETDFMSQLKASDTGVDTNGILIYDCCRSYARSSDAGVLEPIAKLDSKGLVPKAWKKPPVEKLFRGVRLPKKSISKILKDGSITLKPTEAYSSWTAKKKVALGFIVDQGEPGILVQKKIKSTDILIYIPAVLKALKIPASAWDFDDEGEVLVKSTDETLTIVAKEIVQIEEG